MYSRLAGLLLVTAFTLGSCAQVVPDWHSRPMGLKSKVHRFPKLHVTPWGMSICDDRVDRETGKHTATRTMRVNQFHEPWQNVYLSDNGQGVRFEPGKQSIGGTYHAGIGYHKIWVGTYIFDDKGERHITWQVTREYTVKCCHGDDGSRVVEESDVA